MPAMDDGPDLSNVMQSTGSWIWANGSGCGCMKAIPLAALVARYGPHAPLREVRLKMKCATCGQPPASFTLPGPGKTSEPIPRDRVPASMLEHC